MRTPPPAAPPSEPLPTEGDRALASYIMRECRQFMDPERVDKFAKDIAAHCAAQVQEATAALREECHRLRSGWNESATVNARHTIERSALVEERDSLQQQLKERETEVATLTDENVKLNGYADMHMKAKARLEASEALVKQLREAAEEAYHSSVNARPYPDGPNLPRDVRQSLRSAIDLSLATPTLS